MSTLGRYQFCMRRAVAFDTDFEAVYTASGVRTETRTF